MQVGRTAIAKPTSIIEVCNNGRVLKLAAAALNQFQRSLRYSSPVRSFVSCIMLIGRKTRSGEAYIAWVSGYRTAAENVPENLTLDVVRSFAQCKE
jgi:hypothetical protein